MSNEVPASVSSLPEKIRGLMLRGEHALVIDAFESDPTFLEGLEGAPSETRSYVVLSVAKSLASVGQHARCKAFLAEHATTIGQSHSGRFIAQGIVGWAEFHAGRSSEAIEMLRQSILALRQCMETFWIAEISRWLAYAQYSVGDCVEAITHYYESLASATRLSDAGAIARARLGLARVYRKQGKFEDSLLLFEKALSSFELIGSASMTLRISLDLSVVNRQLGHLPVARNHALRALAVAEESGDRLGALLATIAMGRVAFQLTGQSQELLEASSRLVREASGADLYHPLVLGLEDVGDIAFASESYQEALAAYLSAFERIESPSDGEYSGELAWRIGLCHSCLGDFEKAHSWIQRGIRNCENSGDAKELALTIRARGLLLISQCNVDGGLAQLRESLRRLQKLGIPFEVGRSHVELAKVSYQLSRDRKSFDIHLEAAEDIFRGMGSGLGLRWVDDLRHSSTWDGGSPSDDVHDCAIEESILGQVPEPRGTTSQIRFAPTTLEVKWKSPKFLEALELLRHYARSRSPLLIAGETGAGKTALAEAAHILGPNPRDPFVILNCASLPEALLESELFGHVRGAFTGAERDNSGLIRSAGSGTVFLDEVDKASMSFQANLLHVLDRREIRAVGSHAFHEVRARFIVATNRDISSLTTEGRFLPDLEFRVSGLRVDVPPLRERIADFDLLLALALREIRIREGVSTSISVEARNFLTTYRWPGNVRELFNVVLASGLLVKSGMPITLAEVHRVFQDPRRLGHVQKTKMRGDLATQMEALEKEYLLMTLRLEGGSQSRAAAKLGITRRGLNKKLHRFGLLSQIEEEGLENFSYRKGTSETTSKEQADEDAVD